MKERYLFGAALFLWESKQALFLHLCGQKCKTMKKICLFLSFVTLNVLAFAQAPKLGIKAGVNVASTTNNVSGESSSKAGLHAGLLAHIHLTPEFSLQPEVMYSQQGGKVSDVNLTLHYINIPLLLQYNFSNGFRLQTGPQVGFLVGVSDKINGNTSNVFSSNDFKNTEFAWSFGLSYLSYSGLGVDARYNLGLSQINDLPASAGKTKNRVFQFGLFYLFDHHHKAASR